MWAHGRRSSGRLQASDFSGVVNGGPSTERGRGVSELREKMRSVRHAKYVVPEAPGGGYRCRTRAQAQQKGGRQSTQERRSWGTPLPRARRTALPRPSRLLPATPRSFLAGVQVHGIPRDRSKFPAGAFSCPEPPRAPAATRPRRP